MTTIKDIARLANVSRTTVSRYINNNGYVSEEARKRIIKAIKETGYIPSAQAKSLRTKRSSVIGVILPKISTETASRVVNGINGELSKFGFQTLLANTQLNDEKEIEYIKLLQGQQVDGIILLATNINDRLLEAIRGIKVPFISLGQDLPGVTSIVYDDYNASVELTEHLIERGHRKIAFIGVDEKDRAVGYLRKKAFLDTCGKFDCELDENWLQTGDFSYESGYEAMDRILTQSKARPTAIFAVTDRMAIGAIEYLKERNISIPEDIAIVGIGASDLSKYITPPLTTVDYFNEEAGKKAAKYMLEKLENKHIEYKSFTLNYRLIVRNSV
ncbi:LacI family DNA-binding transcriptional regulator [Pseudalkalibacillus sp. R45]|uniref:LacI family DNA-binding transcriptional regulator n=1 Tax=Pseudalkalibacillus sp. R45 TaxID=3457433 RepID=UPI003FCCA283